MFDGLLAAGHLDGAIVFAGAEFPLDEDMRAFTEARSQLRETLSVSDNVVPLRLILPLAFVVLPGACRGDRELGNRSSVR